jgi:hypothetical protein
MLNGIEIKVSTPPAEEQTEPASLRRPGRNPLECRTPRRTPQIVLILQIQPELRRKPKINPQSQG